MTGGTTGPGARRERLQRRRPGRRSLRERRRCCGGGRGRCRRLAGLIHSLRDVRVVCHESRCLRAGGPETSAEGRLAVAGGDLFEVEVHAHPRALQDPGELVGPARARERLLGVDDAAQREVGERLLHRLHAALRAGLHERVDLLDLGLPDQVPDGVVGKQDLERGHAALAVGGRERASG